MKAVVIREPGGPEVLALRDVPAPDAGPSQIRVHVAATALNRADLLQRRGLYPAPPGWPPDIPGLEYAGTVHSVGAGVSRWRTGDRVMGLVGGGACAEAVVVHEDEALAVPPALSLPEAASLPEAFITAHDALVTQMRVQAGEWILIHGAGSGVGTAAVQIARRLGARTLGTSRSAWKLERGRAEGLDVGIEVGGTGVEGSAVAGDVGGAGFVEEVLAATGGRGADGILDLVGGPYVAGDVAALAERGRIVIVGLVAGATCELDMRALMRKRGTIRGTTLRNRSLAEKIEATRAFGDFALPLFEAGHLRPTIHTTLPMARAAAAHTLLESNQTYGKIVLTW